MGRKNKELQLQLRREARKIWQAKLLRKAKRRRLIRSIRRSLRQQSLLLQKQTRETLMEWSPE